MQLNEKNLYIKEHKDGYIVCIEMPDSSRNYLHCEPVKDLSEAIWIMQDFDGSMELEDAEVNKDGEYYRINIVLTDGRNKPQLFHSRKLNLNDAIFERRLLLDSATTDRNGSP